MPARRTVDGQHTLVTLFSPAASKFREFSAANSFPAAFCPTPHLITLPTNLLDHLLLFLSLPLLTTPRIPPLPQKIINALLNKPLTPQSSILLSSDVPMHSLHMRQPTHSLAFCR